MCLCNQSILPPRLIGGYLNEDISIFCRRETEFLKHAVKFGIICCTKTQALFALLEAIEQYGGLSNAMLVYANSNAGYQTGQFDAASLTKAVGDLVTAFNPDALMS